MPRKILPVSIVAALAAMVPFTPANATPATTHAAPAQPAITVRAPNARRTGTTYSGIPVFTYTASSVVHYGDLNLASLAGRDALHSRVRVAATSACGRLDHAYPVQTEYTSDYKCINRAVAGAKTQVRAAIAAAA
ncbi:UrcA family protein [Novosphingobium sp. ZN18A2]|uniref:UrcA family protein n=1 Tax=Novosphingobium sp. ZN18A2 TaxID=3079861 RepID=UPI0030D3AA47